MAFEDQPAALPFHNEGESHTKDNVKQCMPCIRHQSLWWSTLGVNFKYFFIETWLDWLLIATVGAVAIGFAPRTFTRLFPITAPDGSIYRPDLAYPYVKPIFSPVAAGVIAAAIPISIFAIAQFWQRSFDDFASAFLGISYSMVTGTCAQVILKKTIGGLRPHFLAVCQPVERLQGTGFKSSLFTAAEVCTGDSKRIANALESFPSGHAEVVFSGLGFLAIYLFTHLRVTNVSGQRRKGYWAMLLIVAPLLLATFLSATLVLGYHHHVGDVVFGGGIGGMMALLGYRMVFQGIWDPRWNTVPCLRIRAQRGQHSETPEGERSTADTARQAEGML